MKIRKNIKTWLMLAAVSVIGMTAVSCSDQPDAFELTDGVPTVKYVRSVKVTASDSLMTGAYMGNTICLVGDNLTSIKELYFNDQKAILNTSLITKNTLIVDVPKQIPTDVSDKIYMVTGNDEKVSYDFKVLVPSPQVNSMDCEFAKPGTEVTIYGDYFIDDPQPEKALKITMAGNVEVKDIVKITKTAITFVVPNDAVPGYINVSTQYGSGRSKFVYENTTNGAGTSNSAIMFDFDGSHGGLVAGHGWRNGMIHADGADGAPSLDGSYIYFGGCDLSGEIGGSWAEDNFCVNYWPEPEAGYPELSSMPKVKDLIAKYGVSGLQMKFEYYIPKSNPWSTCAMQIIFSGNSEVTYATATNGYYGSSTLARGLWMPWKTTGSYDSGDKWLTYSINLSDFNKLNDGTSGGSFDETKMTGLTLFVWHGGVAGTDCSPIILIDNIRITPIE